MTGLLATTECGSGAARVVGGVADSSIRTADPASRVAGGVAGSVTSDGASALRGFIDTGNSLTAGSVTSGGSFSAVICP